MINKLYCIYDKVAKEYGPVFESKNDGVALRSYYGLLGKTEGLFKEEYVLYCIGTLDKETCAIDQAPGGIYEVYGEEMEIEEK